MPELETFDEVETRISCETHRGEIIDSGLALFLLRHHRLETIFQKFLTNLKCDLGRNSEIPCEPKIIS